MAKSRRNFGGRHDAAVVERSAASLSEIMANGNGAASAAAPAASVAAGPSEFLSRDLTWLEFNRRVLHEALDDRTPLLERVRFLGIFTSNLDEYFMKRVGGLKRADCRGRGGAVAGWNDAGSRRWRRFAMRSCRCSPQQADVLQKCSAAGAGGERGFICSSGPTSAKPTASSATRYFRANVFPVLTPLAVDPGIPFPFISNLSTSLAVVLHHPDQHENLFARVKVPGGAAQVDRPRAPPPTAGRCAL